MHRDHQPVIIAARVEHQHLPSAPHPDRIRAGIGAPDLGEVSPRCRPDHLAPCLQVASSLWIFPGCLHQKRLFDDAHAYNVSSPTGSVKHILPSAHNAFLQPALHGTPAGGVYVGGGPTDVAERQPGHTCGGKGAQGAVRMTRRGRREREGCGTGAGGRVRAPRRRSNCSAIRGARRTLSPRPRTTDGQDWRVFCSCNTGLLVPHTAGF
jgi:hypothetical protein